MDDRERLAAQLAAVELRLASLEERLLHLEGGVAPAEASAERLQFTFEELPASPFPARRRVIAAPRPFPVTELLGWGGVAALVLAAAYLIKLGIDLGWLTPGRQIMLAVIAGLALVGGGTLLRWIDRDYAALLPAGGIAILFFAAYGAHLYYRLIPFGAALAAVILICLGSLWLCRYFQSEMYAFFAVAGSYSAPLLLDGLRTGVGELALYYTAWSLLFCVFAVWLGRRSVYLVAACLALLGFDVVWYAQWHNLPRPPWLAAVAFQGVQAAVIAGCTMLFSLRHRDALDRPAAWAHLPPLLLFYVLQYALLERHLPGWAPWLAILSAAVLASCYWVVRGRLGGPLPGGQLIVAVYAAVVLFHAGYLEALPDDWQPWAGLAAGAAMAAWLLTRRLDPWSHGAVLVALGLIFMINLTRATLNFDLQRVAGGDWLALAYAVELYAGFALARHAALQRLVRGALVYAGHLAALAAAATLLDSRLAVSSCWAVLAVACLGLALQFRDRLLAQSSLLVFAFAGIKVLLYDLAGAAPLVRIGSLVVLGASLYLGGWLYRRIPADHGAPSPVPGCGTALDL
jgi:uncharacterized membrane protein